MVSARAACDAAACRIDRIEGAARRRMGGDVLRQRGLLFWGGIGFTGCFAQVQ